eukprot:CAMPEP_0178464264 /NCGR_PEP_ID=MMETSP0689_2-20121128/50752_1 /TAXON_ID=160604 /ORGANISM="Amphidinium massartii, Strain CS-259" /LENGTH=47 /DNA_ID= /DNA_START= /DNA_END= /DNA_ORIENTATION=
MSSMIVMTATDAKDEITRTAKLLVNRQQARIRNFAMASMTQTLQDGL